MTIEFGRGKDKQKRKARRKKIYSQIREQGRRDAGKGTAGDNQRQALSMSARGMAAYAAGRGDVAVNRAKKKYGEVKTSLGEKGAAALGKAKDYMGKAKSAASELTGKAKSAVSSGYSAVKEKAQDLLKKRKGGSAESYARAIEALEFEVAKQVGILEFASDRHYIEFGRGRDKQKRKSRGMSTATKVGLGAAGVVGTAAAVRYGGAGLAQKGLNKALKRSNLTKGEAVDSFRQGAVNAMRSDAGKAIGAARSAASAPGKAYRRVKSEAKAIGRSYSAGRRSGMGRLESARRAITTKNKVKRNTGSFKGLGK